MPRGTSKPLDPVAKPVCALKGREKPFHAFNASVRIKIYHLVFSTKHREPWFAPEVRPKLHAYLGGILNGLDGKPHAVGGIGDHVHVLAGLKPTHRLSDVMRELKANSSAWIKTTLGLAAFEWQKGYGAFTVSAPDLEGVRSYVLNQEEHHRNRTFQEEYVAMLKRGLIEYDDKFLW